MTPTPNSPVPLSPLRRLASWIALAAGSLALLVACGGGVGTQGTGTGPSGFAGGPISGFGSIIVNGVHFDETGVAEATDDEGHVFATATLQLGQTVQIDSGEIVAAAAKATAIHVSSDLIGPVTAAYDAATGVLGVLGQPVKINAGVALDSLPGGAAALRPGDVVEVYSLFDPLTGVYVATRIDLRPSVRSYKARGAVAALDTAARTFRFGSQVFDYTGVAPPSGLAAGQVLWVALQKAVNGAGQWVVVSFGAAPRRAGEGAQAEIKGVVDAFTDATHFSVAGQAVDAGGAAVTPTGSTVAAGGRVEVEGRIVAGVLVATRVSIESSDDGEHGGGGSGGGGGVEIDGALLSAADTVAKTFQLRGPTTVNYATATFTNGGEADLVLGAKVEMKGQWSADGLQVIATTITFDH